MSPKEEEKDKHPTNKVHLITDLLLDILWRDDDAQAEYRDEWQTLTPDQRQRAQTAVSGEIEMVFGRRGDPLKGCGPLEFTQMVLGDHRDQPLTLFDVAVGAFLDLAWRGDPHDRGDWDAATDEERKRIRDHVAGDVEGWLRQGDPYRGQTPLEYLAAKDKEQERLRARVVAAQQESDRDKTRETLAQEFLDEMQKQHRGAD